jgi:hypothetical protein
MNFSEFYKNHTIYSYKNNNIPEVKKSAEFLLTDITSKRHKWLLVKVKNHIDRIGLDFSISDVLHQIVSNDLIASLFCKSTTKQNSSEVLQLKYLEEVRGIKLYNLPATGNETWRFILRTGKFIQTPKNEGYTSHSFDFRYIGKYDYFIMGKLTTTRGGGQNQQRQEMLDIIDDMKLFFENNPNSNIRFVLLLDGDSYVGNGIYPFLEKVKSDNRILIENSDTLNVE